jgi:hypothetical protein
MVMSDATDKKAACTGAVVGGVAGGVTGGMAAGAAIGGMTGPIGAVVGAALGAAAGALVGKVAAVDPEEEEAYWRANYANRPYVTSGATFEDYGPAYRHGVDAYARYPQQPFENVEPELSRSWGTARGSSSLEWENAKHATRAAWQRMSDRVERAVPGDSDRDGC